MICSTCRGSGKFTYAGRVIGEHVYPGLPCRDCGGSGIAHCCEGERCQPDAERSRGKPADARKPPPLLI